MADLTLTLADKPLDRAHYSHIQWVRRVVNLTDLADGANEVITVPAEYALVAGYVLSRVTATSGGSATLKAVFGGDLTSTISVANLAKGKVTQLTLNTPISTYVTTATKVSLTNATAVYTAGQVEVAIGIVKVHDNT